ncbi:MAG TPA: heme-binding protein [Candidatus Polarisedimenticolaceae bacterium]|nr:heme-binding protein [Candidatus Polarisedimenticolaceae bacterium]
MKRTALLLTLGAALAGTVLAQPATSDAPEKSEKKILTLAGARNVAAAAESEGARGGAAPAIAVVDDGGHVLLVVRPEGTFAAAADVSVQKARTAALFRKETIAFENAVNGGRYALLGVDVMTPLMGGVPIVADGQVIGAIGISGAKSQQQDDAIARVAAAVIK